MPRKRHIVTIRDQRGSVWQSVMEKVAKREVKQVAAPVCAATERAVTWVTAPSPVLAADALQGHLYTLIEAANTHFFERDEMLQGRITDSLSICPAPTRLAAGGGPLMAKVSGLNESSNTASQS
ncbi:MAG TPA: hypothetical protein VGX46_06485 [Vicinamibacterales bacterium]|nr:hypothetical protein [Vicinamibacterales bacterium]